MQGDALRGIESLNSAEAKYTNLLFLILRVENAMPFDCYREIVRVIHDYDVSAFCVYCIIQREIFKREENIYSIAKVLREENELSKAIGLLQIAKKEYPDNKEVILLLADCWIEAQQWEQVYECLKEIKEPTYEIVEMIGELEKVIEDDKVK